MSNYTQTTDFSAKDNLASGDSEKKILGADVDAEFTAISTAITSKGDATTTIIPPNTQMFFIASAAPSGWTIVDTHNDKVIVLKNTSNVNSSAGTTGGNWSIGNTQLTLNAPNHTHSFSANTGNYGSTSAGALSGSGWIVHNQNHYHSVSGTTGAGGASAITKTGSMVNGTWRPAYVETIVCSKNA